MIRGRGSAPSHWLTHCQEVAHGTNMRRSFPQVNNNSHNSGLQFWAGFQALYGQAQILRLLSVGMWMGEEFPANTRSDGPSHAVVPCVASTTIEIAHPRCSVRTVVRRDRPGGVRRVGGAAGVVAALRHAPHRSCGHRRHAAGRLPAHPDEPRLAEREVRPLGVSGRAKRQRGPPPQHGSG